MEEENQKIDDISPFCGTTDVPYYRPQRSWAKVIFSQACLSTGGGRGVSASVHAGIPPREQTPPGSRHPHPLPPGAEIPPEQTREQTPHPPHPPTPPGSRLQHTVNERPVRILLELNSCLNFWCRPPRVSKPQWMLWCLHTIYNLGLIYISPECRWE